MSFMVSWSSALILYSLWMMISSISKFLLRIEYKITTFLPYLPSLLSQVSFDDWIGPVLKKNRTTAPPSLRTVFKNEFRAKNVPKWPKMAPKGPKTATAKSEFFATWAEFQWRWFQKSFFQNFQVILGYFGQFWYHFGAMFVVWVIWGKSKMSQTGHVPNQNNRKRSRIEWRWFQKSFSRGSRVFGPFRGHFVASQGHSRPRTRSCCILVM